MVLPIMLSDWKKNTHAINTLEQMANNLWRLLFMQTEESEIWDNRLQN